MVRHHRPGRFPGRGRYLVLGAVALIGIGVAGVSVVTAGADDDAPEPTAVALDEQSRAEATARADRADREPVPSPSATATTPPVPVSPAPPATTKKTPATRATSTPAKPKPKPKPKAAWVNPMPAGDVTSCYGMRWGVLHAGIDLAAPAGTTVRAAAAGTVVNAGWDFTGYGISVVIDHGNGYLTHYAHLSETAAAVGDRVAAGETIGYEGSTGDSTGPHLHFEVHQGQLWSQIEPAAFMRARGVDLGC
ncbi:M23 family metallopeptidase [Micromonospora sp. CPCC 206060]